MPIEKAGYVTKYRTQFPLETVVSDVAPLDQAATMPRKYVTYSQSTKT
jgi:hypothetical protein